MDLVLEWGTRLEAHFTRPKRKQLWFYTCREGVARELEEDESVVETEFYRSRFPDDLEEEAEAGEARLCACAVRTREKELGDTGAVDRADVLRKRA